MNKYNDDDVFFKCGIVDLGVIIDEANAEAKLKDIGVCEIVVHGSEGPVPHFHLKSKSSKFETCIRIDKADYFLHGKYKDKLTNSTQKKVLDQVLRSTAIVKDSILKEDATVWDTVCLSWKLASNPEYIKFPKHQPDYNNLP